MLLSIVVPIYNAAIYLNDCLTSLTGQSYDDIEIICVDDGSTDSSTNILRSWKMKDRRIIVIQQENQGPGAARNRGIDVSRGQFITFVDADDMVRKDIYTSTIPLMTKHDLDMLMFSFETFPNGHAKTFSFPTNKVVDYHELFTSNTRIQSENALCFNWRCIFRSTLIKTHHLKFHEDIYYGEDMLFNIDAVCHGNRIMVSDAPLYLYRKNSNGAMSKSFKPLLEDSLVKAYDLKIEQIAQYHLDRYPHYRSDLAEYYIKVFLPMLITNEYNRPEQQNIHQAISHILSLKMIRESFNEIGFRNIHSSWKNYMLYLTMKFKMTSVVKHIYDNL